MPPALVCIIDDDESLRLALMGLVRSLGYETRGFGSAEDFLQSDAIEDCACLVTDIQMPGMSGIDLKRYLVEQRSLLPVIMITARPDPNLEEKARVEGAACFLKKPFEANALIACIECALESQS